jgi:hypothetical protein
VALCTLERDVACVGMRLYCFGVSWVLAVENHDPGKLTR